MGLRVWLPLNGSLENQGLSNVSITNNGATIDTAGKVGSCYYFLRSTPNYLKIDNCFTTSSNGISMAFWVKIPSNASGNNQVVHIGNGSGWDKNRCTCFIRTGKSTIVFCCGDGTGTTSTSSTQYNCESSAITLNVWTHVTCVYTPGTMQIYLNGVLNKTYTTSIVPSFTNVSYIGVAAAPDGGEPATIYLNDVRIYDHALSVKEVRELARGLVVHYKLDKLNGTKVVDCSGFKNHGTATNITIANSSPRYTASSQLPQSASAIQVGNFSTVVSNGNFTFNVWFKKVTGEWSSKSWETVLGGPSGFELEGKIRATTYNYIHPYSWGGGGTDTPNSYSFEYSLDEWHMLTMTRTASATKFYLDGILKVTGTAGSIPSGNYFLGSWRDTTSQNYRGYMSDARVYVTILTDKQILELYNESAAIARDGTTFAREFVEATL